MMNRKRDDQSLLNNADLKAQERTLNVQYILEEEALNLIALKKALIELFEYLSSKEGRTDINCMTVCMYFIIEDHWSDRNLPDSFQNVFGDIAGALHDTVSSPEIAQNFYSTPEQLLQRIKEL